MRVIGGMLVAALALYVADAAINSGRYFAQLLELARHFGAPV